MMPSSTVEDYIKRIYQEQQGSPGELVAMGKVAAGMGVVPGTATSMVKALAEAGLVEYEPRGGTRLTAGGERLALHVLRRHRLVELFLVEMLGMSWTEVHEEAEDLEHAVSDKVIDRIDAVLGHPAVDPHGDPIPSATGAMKRPRLHALASCEPGTTARVGRIADQDPAFLSFLDQAGLAPGTQLELLTNNPHAGAVTLKPADRDPVTLGSTAAAKILVRTEGKPK
jgi:DtxR family Mn-dependent transcriptional regulator